MDVPEGLPVEIDRGERTIRIFDSQTVYGFIDSGAVLSLFPVWECLQAAAETVDPLLTHLTRLLEAAFLYFCWDYEIRHVRRVHLPTSTAVASTPPITVRRGD
jgi:hypothetical protein